jgi:hypothetical protein
MAAGAHRVLTIEVWLKTYGAKVTETVCFYLAPGTNLQGRLIEDCGLQKNYRRLTDTVL